MPLRRADGDSLHPRHAMKRLAQKPRSSGRRKRLNLRWCLRQFWLAQNQCLWATIRVILSQVARNYGRGTRPRQNP